MKFKDVSVRGDKKHFQKQIRYRIFKRVQQQCELDYGVRLSTFALSYCRIMNYLDILIEESEYNPRTNVFYYLNYKLNYQLLAKVALEYIMEHINEFTNN